MIAFLFAFYKNAANLNSEFCNMEANNLSKYPVVFL